MGRDEGFLAYVRAVCPNLIHIPEIEAPLHLAVTAQAFAGIISYTRTSLNNLFCAPNKMWEYAGAGVPMLCDDLPGLSAVAEAGAGVKCDFRDNSAVRESLLRIESHYETYRLGARHMFECVDIESILQRILLRCGFTNAPPGRAYAVSSSELAAMRVGSRW
jgi:hypothetical protein